MKYFESLAAVLSIETLSLQQEDNRIACVKENGGVIRVLCFEQCLMIVAALLASSTVFSNPPPCRRIFTFLLAFHLIFPLSYLFDLYLSWLSLTS